MDALSWCKVELVLRVCVLPAHRFHVPPFAQYGLCTSLFIVWCLHFWRGGCHASEGTILQTIRNAKRRYVHPIESMNITDHVSCFNRAGGLTRAFWLKSHYSSIGSPAFSKFPSRDLFVNILFAPYGGWTSLSTWCIRLIWMCIVNSKYRSLKKKAKCWCAPVKIGGDIEYADHESWGVIKDYNP